MSIGGIRGSNYFTPEGTVPFCQHNQPRERDDDEPPFHPPNVVMATIHATAEDPDPGDVRAWTRRETHDGRMPLDEDE